MAKIVLQYVFYLAVFVVLAIPLGSYIGKVMNGEKVFLTKLILPCEKIVYKIMKIDIKDEMSWKTYLKSVLMFNVIGLVFLFLLQLFQGDLFGNPQKLPGVSWDLAFNTAVSFVTNTNWQAYNGESTLSYLTQAIGLTVQNFVSAATGIAVLFALIRGFVKTKTKFIGNFWIDITRIIMYILVPLNIVISIGLVSQGVVQSFNSAETVELIEPIAISKDGNIIENAKIDLNTNKVYLNNEVVNNAEIITKEIIPLGPAASQIAIKQTGTNGGGFYGVNSAHPLENPTIISNLLEMTSIILIPAALCFTFGRNVGNKKQGIAIFIAMFIILVGALGVVAVNEQLATPQLAQEMVDISTNNQAGGNMEGKESRFGIAASATWATFTTAASNGSVNSMHDSYTPLGGMITMLLMQLGEVVFGGVGCGLYGMLAFVILTVFIAGLMVGRTPEFLGKKIEPFEMKCAVLVCLTTPIAILVGSGIAVVFPGIEGSLNNIGTHGFSEILYSFSSASANNGSAFSGFNANTIFLNLSLGICMLFTRFLPIIGTLAIAGSIAKKKNIATTTGTLSTTNELFIFMLILIVIVVGALSFFPALALGPIAEYFSSLL